MGPRWNAGVEGELTNEGECKLDRWKDDDNNQPPRIKILIFSAVDEKKTKQATGQ